MSAKKTFILAAGGTGGHLFPAQALGEALQAEGHRVVLMTDRRFAAYTKAFDAMEVRTIRAGGLQRGWRLALSLADIAIGIGQAFLALRQLKPAAVVGFGGYPSFPTMYAASLLGLPTIIHEQNALLGRANRVIATRVDAIATSFPTTGLVAAGAQAKLVHTGNPVRAGVCALRQVPYPTLPSDGTIRLLVMGGSQGASVFATVVPAAIAALPKALRSRIRMDQQCRAEDLPTAREAYAAIGLQPDLAPFFTDIPARLAAAHLVISRAGASSVCEFTVAGRPSVLVPLPTSADNHQMVNAQAVEDAGGAWVMPQSGFTPAALAARLEGFLNAPDTLAHAAEAARDFGQPDATQKLRDVVLKLAR